MLKIALGNLPNLKQLYLRNNQLSSARLDWQLTQSPNIVSGFNQLTALPESLGNLLNLQELSLDGNQLTALPESLGNLQGLQRIVSFQQQTHSTARKWIGNLPNLQNCIFATTNSQHCPKVLATYPISKNCGFTATDSPILTRTQL